MVFGATGHWGGCTGREQPPECGAGRRVTRYDGIDTPDGTELYSRHGEAGGTLQS